MLNSKFDLYKNEWLDLVFTDRNKSYGAYDLRAHYGDNMMKALAITLTGFTIAAISLTIAFRHDIVPADCPPILNKVDVELPKTPPKFEEIKEAKLNTKKVDLPKTSTVKQTNVPTTKFVVPKITSEEVKTDFKMPDPDLQIASVDNKGDASKPSTTIFDGGTPGKTDVGVKGDDNGESAKIFDGVEVMPEPVGGAAAWSKFLQRNLRYPDTEVEGRVILSFVVEKDGHLTDIQVVKGVLSELDREALRVLKLAPAWKPGKQNGQPVRVKYTIPIVFMLNQ